MEQDQIQFEDVELKCYEELSFFVENFEKSSPICSFKDQRKVIDFGELNLLEIEYDFFDCIFNPQRIIPGGFLERITKKQFILKKPYYFFCFN